MRVLAVALVVLAFALPLSAQDPAVEQAMDAIGKAFVDGFNAGDAAAITSVYAESADAVGFDGSAYKGRAEIQEAFVQTLETYKGSKIQFSRTGLHVVAPDVVVMDGSWEVSGGTIVEDSPRQGFLTFIVEKQDDSWQVVAVRAKAPPPTN